ncbi:DUF2806 domain-containing protein [Rhizobium leguminosarum]|uniref:DUF2806 domain-containing protein n=1 Tax=Rhizobium leguminosarum TaxID=384 RepID=UPI0013F15EF5|nr:DUF2806 domain-containing protein [Rhizobium leguminosarum]
MSALDRAGARKIDRSGLEDERKAAVHQALTDAQVRLIGASAKVLEERIQGDPDLAQRALTAFSRLERQVENVEASLVLAIEDLKSNPSTEEEPADSPDALEPEFLNRWELYASGATSEVVREKWGRILSSEIRKPGTFSLKTLRIIDELDQETALLFERFCQNTIGNWVPELLLGLNHVELSDLAQAGLILENEMPMTVSFFDTKNDLGLKWWAYGTKTFGIVIRQEPLPPIVATKNFSLDPIRIVEGKLIVNVTVLSKVGTALAAIIPHDEGAAYRRLAAVISENAEGGAIAVRRLNDGWVAVTGNEEDASTRPADDKFSSVRETPNEAS